MDGEGGEQVPRRTGGTSMGISPKPSLWALAASWAYVADRWLSLSYEHYPGPTFLFTSALAVAVLVLFFRLVR